MNRYFFGLSLGIAILFSMPANAQKWRVNVGGGFATADGELVLDRVRKVVNIDVEGGPGFYFGTEYRLGRKVGIELSLFRSRMKYIDEESFASGGGFESSDILNFTRISSSLNYHFLAKKTVDPYVSLLAGYISYGSELKILTELPSPSLGPNPMPTDVSFDLHGSFSMGLALGADLYLGSGGWFLGPKVQLNISDLEASIINDPEDDGRDIDLSINPLILVLAVGKEF